MKKLIIDRSKWCSISMHKTRGGKLYGCALGWYLSALGIAREALEGTMERHLDQIPKEGGWLKGDGEMFSEEAFKIMFASDFKSEDSVIEKFKEYANLDVIYTGIYPKD